MGKYEVILMKAHNFASMPIIVEACSAAEAEAKAEAVWGEDPFSIDWCEPEVEYIGADAYKMEDDE